jgi:hypothetical protein
MAVKFLPPSAHTGKGRETWLVRGTPSPVALLYGLQRTVDALAFQSSLAVCARAHYTVRSVCLESIRASCTAFWEGDLTISAASPLNTHKQPPIKQTSRLFAAYRQSRGKWPACCPSHLGTGDRHQASVGYATGVFASRQALYACEGLPLLASLTGGARGRYAACPELAQIGLQGDRSDTCPGL